MAQPLEKISEDGRLYTRPSSVESNIDGALGQDERTLNQRLLETDKDSKEYLKSECLVHLIREFQRRGDRQLGNAAVQVLLTRCEAILLWKIDAMTVPNAELLREDILGEFAVMLARDGTGENRSELDFFECRFNSAFRTFRIDFVRRERSHRQQFRPMRARPVDNDEEGDEQMIKDGDPGYWPSATDGTDASDLLQRLPEDHRRAYVLHHLMGYEVESIDKSKPTVATICKVGGRTVRNWLRKAQHTLTELTKEDV